MNSKAQRQTIAFPPLLQMMHDEPVVDASFRNVERINAPYINDMLTPVWIKDTESKAVYDKDGNRYELDSENYLTRNGEQLFQVENKKFVREDVTSTLSKYHDYDLSNNHEAYTIWNYENKTFTIHFDDIEHTTDVLYNDGVVVTSRIRILGNKAVFVVYYDISDTEYVNVYTLDNAGVYGAYKEEAKWYRHQIRRNASENPIYGQYYLENASPIINIGQVMEDVVGISLVSSYGKSLNSARNYFITYFIVENEMFQIGPSGGEKRATPNSTTNSTVVERTISGAFRFSQKYNKSSVTGVVASTDGTTFYDYENGVIGNERTFDNYYPVSLGSTTEIDGVTYNLYRFNGISFDVYLDCFSNDAPPYSITATFNDVDYSGTCPVDQTKARAQVPAYIVYGVDDRYRPGNFTNARIIWHDRTFDISDPYITNGNTLYLTFSYSDTVNAGWLVSPNIVLDNGRLKTFWGINPLYSRANDWNNQTLQTGSIIEEGGYMTECTLVRPGGLPHYVTYTILPDNFITVTDNYKIARSNSFACNQNFVSNTVKMNNTSATSPWTLYNEGGTAGKESTASKYVEYNFNSNGARWFPGTTKDTSFNYFGNQMFSGDSVVGNEEDLLIFLVQGYRVEIRPADRFLLGSKAAPFNILYNTDASNTCLAQGISYSSDTNAMGTLLTPWQSVDDDFYIVANSECVIYRDKSGKYYKISIVEGNDVKALLDDRYILVNTTSYWNMFDTVLMKKFHYATDYNGRAWFGNQISAGVTPLPGANDKGTTSYSRITATAINAAYAVMPMYGVSSILMNAVTRNRVGINAERAQRSTIKEDTDVQPIDIYYGDIGATAPVYRYSLYPYSVYDRIVRFDLEGTSYTTSNILYYSPNIFTDYISGAGNNDMVRETYSTFTLTYYDQQPFFLYNATSEVASKNGEAIHFFVLQGQFYAFMNEKIYAMTYSKDGSISSQSAIIDCRGMKFIGNNPQIAFFWSPRDRSIYSFTGDAILMHLYNANKFSEMRNFWYDETTQSIYVATDIGLLVLGQKNTYLFEDWKDVALCQFSNDTISHITNSDTTINLSYYKVEDYAPLPLDLETSFYGLGDNEYTSIDRWDIVLFNPSENKASEITVGVRSITDVTVKSEEKTFKITPDMWDKWSHSLLLRYVPKLQKGQGIRLYIKTPEIIQRIVPHIADMGTGIVTRRGV